MSRLTIEKNLLEMKNNSNKQKDDLLSTSMLLNLFEEVSSL